jgi:phosphatidate cytidylyltransferase
MDKKRIIIGLSIATVLVLLFCLVPAKNPFGLIALLAVCGIGSWEFYNLLNAGGMPASKKWGTFSGLVLVAATWFYMMETKQPSFLQDYPPDTMLWCVMLLVIISNFFRILAYRNMRSGLENCLGTLLGILYVPFLWSFFVRVYLSGNIETPAWAGFYLLLCMKLSDSGGYFIGTKFGKKRLAPVISPKKSWEGLIGGVVFCTVANIIWLVVSQGRLGSFDFNLGDALALGILFPVVGTAGDLVESMFKRAVDIKDSNTMVYGLGGILDMIDSILFAAPMLYIYMQFVLS